MPRTVHKNQHICSCFPHMQSGMTPVHICAQYGFTDLLDWLCEKHRASPTASLPVWYNIYIL